MPLSHDMGSRNAERVRSRSNWVNEIGKILRLLRNKLSETIEAWQAFKRQAYSYFLSEDGIATTSSRLDGSLASIDAVFSDLRAVLSNLEAQAKIVDEIRLSVSELWINSN